MIKADSNGKVTGRFYIPANVPVGTKLVEFKGKGGSSASATYTGSGTIEYKTLRRVYNYYTYRVDPLAQTFTLSTARHIGGVDLWFKNKGPEEVRVQIRETATGLPTQTVVAESIMSSDDILTNGSATRFTFTPVYLDADQEYAIVVLTDGADHEVAISELGKFDKVNQSWVTSQPYQVGVLLSSSNASTWTSHQNKDLTFRLLGARFTETDKTVELGEFDVTNMTEFKAISVVERPASDTDLSLNMTDTNGVTYQLLEGESMSLASEQTGKIKLQAKLSGTALRSPVLYENVQAVTATVQQTADYISRAIPGGTDVKAIVTFEALLTGDADVDTYIEVNGEWQKVDLHATSAADDGFQAHQYILEGVTSPTIRTKLVLKGNAANRPRVRSLRMITTK
ncbi:hypothetical protein VA7868_03741 [Vibrio aerogenes CECT 7868]|uniref:Uncharacterized protein n=1 Tax=Vibrio aerogenes CECT 7868 TaxID=1216006 RepID=A0A1M6B8P1_9VIBR|nr:hypothetical protein [Vibrio aerogenes]SHI45124.1 hypothetical protein VA7868_03741 [Vibrio aerogenes CECT 7868]